MKKANGRVYQVSLKVGNVGKDLEKFGVKKDKPFLVRFRRTITGVNILGVNGIRAPKLQFFNSKFRHFVKESIGNKARALPNGTLMWQKKTSGDMGDTGVKKIDHTILYSAAAITIALILINAQSERM